MDRPGIHHMAKMYGSPTEDKGGNVMLRCPLAAATHAKGVNSSPALSVKVDPNGPSLAHCFSCKAGGTLVSIFTEAHGMVGGFSEVVAYLQEADRGGLLSALARSRFRPGGMMDVERKSGANAPGELERYTAICSRVVPDYLVRERGIVRADVDRWLIGFDHELQRATFPCWDEKGYLVGCSRRAVHPKQEPKFYDWPGPWKDTCFYGEHLIDTSRDHAYLVEGVLGTIFAMRVLPNVLGMLGSKVKMTPERLAKLRRWASAVTLILDADSAGTEAVEGSTDYKGKHHAGLKEILQPYFAVKVAHLPTLWNGRAVKDPADVPGDVLAAVAKRAEYLFNLAPKRVAPSYQPPPLPG
jgi:hypothetical protein